MKKIFNFQMSVSIFCCFGGRGGGLRSPLHSSGGGEGADAGPGGSGEGGGVGRGDFFPTRLGRAGGREGGGIVGGREVVHEGGGVLVHKGGGELEQAGGGDVVFVLGRE